MDWTGSHPQAREQGGAPLPCPRLCKSGVHRTEATNWPEGMVSRRDASDSPPPRFHKRAARSHPGGYYGRVPSGG